MPSIYLVGTADTKGEELAFLRAILSKSYPEVRSVDIGTRAPVVTMDMAAEAVALHHPDGASAVLGCDDRGKAVAAMGKAFAAFCKANASDIAGIIGIGGGGGTSMITQGMRELRYGLPKVMVSTLASGDTAPYVDVSDIAMFPSVTDIAGLNRLSRQILHNAAQALLGMVNSPATTATEDKAAIGLSMFGVTTACVTTITEHLKGRYDCLVFHATGTGGRAMEKLLADGVVAGLVDITTTEIADHLFGGVLPAAETRLDAVAATKTPYVGSVGALDMINFWAPETVPSQHKKRLFYHHNPNVTLMRTTPAENAELGRWIGRKLNACDGPVRFLIPEKGISALDIESGAFHDPDADAALFAALADTISETDQRQLIRLPHHINDPAFAAAAAKAFTDIAKV